MLSVETEGEAYSNFADSIANKATLATYGYCLVKYAAYRKQSYNSLITEDRANTKLAEANIKDFLMSLKQRNLSQSYVSSYLKTLKHFYSMNDLLFNWRKISKFATVTEEEAKTKDRAYTHEEIGRMLERATLRMKAMILLLASTGMRLGALPPLKLRNMIRLADPEDVYQITIYEGSKEEYITFCTPKAAKAIASYLDSRCDAGEHFFPASPLFRAEFDPEDQLQARNKIRPMTLGAINSNLRPILDRSAISPRHTLVEGEQAGRIRKDVMRAHGFRKFTNTQMVQADLKGAPKEMLLGHSIGLDDKYYRPTPGAIA